MTEPLPGRPFHASFLLHIAGEYSLPQLEVEVRLPGDCLPLLAVVVLDGALQVARQSARASQKSEFTEQEGDGGEGMRCKLPHLGLDVLHPEVVHQHEHPII